jgi:hypothetical protein
MCGMMNATIDKHHSCYKWVQLPGLSKAKSRVDGPQRHQSPLLRDICVEITVHRESDPSTTNEHPFHSINLKSEPIEVGQLYPSHILSSQNTRWLDFPSIQKLVRDVHFLVPDKLTHTLAEEIICRVRVHAPVEMVVQDEMHSQNVWEFVTVDLVS